MFSMIGFALMLGIAACGGSNATNLCERAGTVSKDLKAKASVCTSLSAAFATSFDKARCDSNLKSCTSADTTAVNAAYDCLEKVPDCVVGKEGDFTTATGACFSSNSTLSSGCKTALSFTVSR